MRDEVKRIKAFHEPGLNILSPTDAIGLLTKIRLEQCTNTLEFPMHLRQVSLWYIRTCAKMHGGKFLI